MSSQPRPKFTILSFTSEDPDYLASNLLRPGPQCKGWQSARFQDYPQVIIFEFPSPMHIKQLQFLSHQSKISSKIEIFTFIPENSYNVPPPSEFKWKRLGYLSLDSNEKSNFQARELKSVFIDSKASHLKLAFHKCHPNKHNMFNQVGLIALNVNGEVLENDFFPKKNIEMDPSTTERLKQLLAARDRAVSNEDYEEAKVFRESIDRLKLITTQLHVLEERKKVAVSNEDYDSAKAIKVEIERLKNSASMPLERPASYGMARPKLREELRTGYERQEKTEKFDKNEPVFTKSKTSLYEEQVIPALGKGKNLHFEAEEEVQKPMSPEGLTQTALKLADPIVHILTEYLCKKVFSKTWQFREEGLNEIQGEIALGEDSQLFQDLNPQQIFIGALGAVRYTLGDKVPQVSLKSMSLLVYVLKALAPGKSFIRGEAGEYLTQVLNILLEKIGDSNNRVRETAELAYFALAKSELVGISQALQGLFKQPKEKLNLKQVHGRVNILALVVEEFRVDSPQVPLHPVADFAVHAFFNPNNDVKSAGQQLLSSIYSLTGHKLLGIISANLRPPQLEAVQKALNITQPDRESRPLPTRKTDQDSICKFCGKDGLVNPDLLDLHYWKDCPMLVACLQCSQVVEILHLNSHMAKECELKEIIGLCPRCKEAVYLDEFEMHIEEAACLPAKPAAKASRCPLCHDDVEPGPNGWVKHILTEGCPNNDRNP